MLVKLGAVLGKASNHHHGLIIACCPYNLLRRSYDESEVDGKKRR